MKANELRIGNLFDQFGNIHEATYCTIKDLLAAPESQLWCKPIPLTEEWLMKFGFVKIANDSEKKKDCDFARVGKLELCYDVDTNSYYPTINEYTILKYVHQIQNLYFVLTGEELTINK